MCPVYGLLPIYLLLMIGGRGGVEFPVLCLLSEGAVGILDVNTCTPPSPLVVYEIRRMLQERTRWPQLDCITGVAISVLRRSQFSGLRLRVGENNIKDSQIHLYTINSDRLILGVILGVRFICSQKRWESKLTHHHPGVSIQVWAHNH